MFGEPVMTNTQKDSGDELEQMLKTFQHDVAATGYPLVLVKH